MSERKEAKLRDKAAEDDGGTRRRGKLRGEKDGYSDQRSCELWEGDLVSTAIHKDTHESYMHLQKEGREKTESNIDAFTAYFFLF